jgi:hypothetical protein
LQAAVLDDEIRMVIEVRSHRRQFDPRFDAGGGQLGGGADSGQLQKLRRIDRAGRENHIALRVGCRGLIALRNPISLSKFNTDGSVAPKQDPAHQRSGHGFKIRASQCRRQVGAGGTAAAAIARSAVDPAKAFLAFSVRIIRQPITGLRRRLNEGGGQRRRLEIGREHRERTRAAMVRIGAVQVLLRAFEVGKDIRVTPARQP